MGGGSVVNHRPRYAFCSTKGSIMSRSLRFATSFVTCVSLAGGAVAASNQSFLKKAMEGDNSEMHLGQIAAKRGASQGVRDFGRMLNTDHAKAKADALAVARAHHVAPTDEMAPEAKAEARKLSPLSGKAFDREFASYMVKDHKQDIADFEEEARTGDHSTAALASRTLPTLRKHLSVAEKLAR